MAYENVKVKPRQTVTQSTSQTKELGIVSEVPMGEWNATTQYEKLNKVRYVSTGGSGVTLLAKKQNQGVEPFVSQGWQEVWMVENYDGGAVSPDGTYPNMSVGNATNAQNDGNGDNIVEQFSDINEKIPSTASAENQLADKSFVNSSINNMAAFYITSNAQGDAFATRAALLSATTFYSGGQTRVPTQNDYAIVRADESQPQSVDGSYPTTRYSYQGGTYPNGQWDFQYVVNNTTLTQAQIDAINSGITAQKIASMDAATVAKYTKPADGIPESDLTADVQTKLNVGTPPAVGMHHIQFKGEPTPAAIWAGTSWEIDTTMQGRVPVGSGGDYTFGSTGGETTHTLTVAEMPKHNHKDIRTDQPASDTTHLGATYGALKGPDNMTGVISGGIPLITGETGDGQAHNNMPPYMVVNYWKRLA